MSCKKLVLSLVGSVLVAGAFFHCSALGQGELAPAPAWRSAVNVEGTSVPAPLRRSFRGQVAVEESGRLVVLYRASRFGVRGVDVVFRGFTLEGRAEDAVVLSADWEMGLERFAPWIHVGNDGTLHALWMERLGRESFLVYRRSLDGGSSWSPAERLPGGIGRFSPKLEESPDSGFLHIVYSSGDRRRGANDVFLYRSEDRGGSWRRGEVSFSEPLGFGMDPSLAVLPGETVAVLWADQTPGGVAAVLNRSRDGGRSWLPEPVSVNDDLETGVVSAPKLVAVDQELSAVWLNRAGRRFEWILDHSGDGGETWGEDTPLLVREADRVQWDVLWDGRRLYLLWFEEIRLGTRQREHVGLVPISREGFRVEEPLSISPEILPKGSRIHSVSGAVVAGRVHVAALVYTPERRMELKILEFVDSFRELWSEAVPGDAERGYLTLLAFDGEAVVAYREGRRRFLPHQPPTGDLILIRFDLAGGNGR